MPIWEKSTSEEIESSLQSLIAEDYLLREILIVFDGYKSFKKEFKIPLILKNKIRYIYCGINRGPGVSRNKGALFTKSKYLFFLDCGDQSAPNRAQLQLKSLLKSDVSFGNINEIFPSGQERIKRGATSFKNAKKIIALRNPFNNVTMAINKQSFFDVGGYENLRVGEDWVLVGKIIKNKLKISCLDLELVKVFVGHNFLKRRYGLKYIKEINKCLKYLFKLKLMNKFTYLISLSCQYFMRRIIPIRILSIVYKLLRE